MKKVATPIICALLLAAAASAKPAISKIQNNYGWMLPGLPNAGIAEGSIFAVIGTDLGPATLGAASGFPLQSSLGGVSATVAVDGQSKSVPLYYVSTNAIAGVLPSDTPVGTGTLTITYNGETGTSPIQVVARAFGILALNGAGSGTVVAQNYSASSTAPPLLGLNQAAHSGENLVIYGTGLGASTNDTALQNTVANWTSTIPVIVYIGGQAVTPDYAGRSGYDPGLDQINFKPPGGIQGCSVSLYIQTGSGANATFSNTVTLPIVDGDGRTCSDPNGLSTADVEAIAHGGYRYGSVSLSRLNFDLGQDVFGFSTGITTDIGSATFAQTTSVNGVVAQTPFTYPSVRSCVVITSNPSQTINLNPPPTTGLDAGAQITAAAMTITKKLMPAEKGYYTEQTPVTRFPDPLLDAEYKLTNGSGGTDVGAFDINVTVLRQTFCGSIVLCVPPALAWTNEAQITTVQRSAGVAVNWTAGDPGGQIQIMGVSSGGGDSPTGTFICTAQNSASGGSFTVPAGILLQLPATATASEGVIPSGFLMIGSEMMVKVIPAPNGLDALFIATSSLFGKGVPYE